MPVFEMKIGYLAYLVLSLPFYCTSNNISGLSNSDGVSRVFLGLQSYLIQFIPAIHIWVGNAGKMQTK